MESVLNIAASLEFWRSTYPADRRPDPDKLENPKRVGRNRTYEDTFPPSYYRYEESSFVASPEFIFLRAALQLPFAQLVAFGSELCSYYAFNPHAPRGFKQREIPLTDKASLSAYLDGASTMHGIRNAHRALPYIVEGSASPMEALDATLLCLPYRYGGYNFETPLMNHRIDLTPEASHITRKSFCIADMYWENARVDLEYHGEFDHAQPDALRRDRQRTNALQTMGISVVELTYGEVSDLASFEAVAMRLATLLGKRIRREYRGALQQRIELRDQLFAWNRHSGTW